MLKGREEELGHCVVESCLRRRPKGPAPTAQGGGVSGRSRCPCVRTCELAGSAGPGTTPPPAARTLSVAPEEEEEYGIEGGPLLPSSLLPLDLRRCPQAR